jgi:hypothetical protein
MFYATNHPISPFADIPAMLYKVRKYSNFRYVPVCVPMPEIQFVGKCLVDSFRAWARTRARARSYLNSYKIYSIKIIGGHEPQRYDHHHRIA